MKKIIIYTIMIFCGGYSFAQTAKYKITEMPTGTLVVTMIPVTGGNISSLSLQIMVPPMTTLKDFVFQDINGPTAGTTAIAAKSSPANAFGVTADILGSYTAGVEVPIMTFKFTSTAPSGTTGAFIVLDNGQNYIEIDGNDVTDSPINLANAVILPIKLKNFDAKPIVGKKASDLKWTSVSEINASHYEIERSADGSNFEFIGKVAAQGNSNWTIDYNYIDNTLPNTRTDDTYYYRLNMVDLDGQTEYSEIRSVRFDNTDVISIKMGPNPTASLLTINMSTSDVSITEAKMNMYDVAGKLVTHKTISTNGITEINLRDFPSGLYNVAVTYNNKIYNNQVIKSN